MNAQSKPDPKELSKAMGVMFGLAIGDALGAPAEFLRLSQIKLYYGSTGIQDLYNSARHSDDTQMSVAVAEALVSAGEKDVESIMAAVREEFIKWYHHPTTPSRAPGKTCLRGVARMEQGVPWSGSGLSSSKGCGSAMRAAPIGYLYQNDPDKLREVAHATGISTHRHPTADVACIGAAYLVKLGQDGVQPEDMIEPLLSFTQGTSGEWEDAIGRVNECLDWEDEERALFYLGGGWVGEEAVALALYCFLRYPDDYAKAVLRGANTDGDSDSIACIAGSISGAYLGIDAIPEYWITRVEGSDYLRDLSVRLAQKKATLRQSVILDPEPENL
jgi:ADP-ribosylglycohydrolase